MASDFNIIPLHRGAKLPCSGAATGPDPFPVAEVCAAEIERRLRNDAPDLIEQLRAHRPSTLGRIGDALASPRMFTFYLGFWSGCMATVGSAIIAARVFQ
jgi:hypothetical protein